MPTRSGDEPVHARSPLRLRLVLAVFGLVTAVVGAVVVRPVAPGWVVGAFVVVAVVAAVDLAVVVQHLRRGPHYQPGPGVPAYRPVETEPAPSRTRPEITESARRRRYLTLMTTCLVLITLAWTWVRFYSIPAAVAMSIVAAVIPPVAVIVANYGVRLPDEPSSPPESPPGQGYDGSDGGPRPPG